MQASRRTVLLAAGGALLGPRLAQAARAAYYELPLSGNARILHLTDTHAQALPVQYRQPSQNLGIGGADGRPPHIVGRSFLSYYDIRPGTRRAHAFTCLDFAALGRRFGPLGGFAHLATVITALRAAAGSGRSLLVDGGDLCQGTGLANLTGGLALVDLANMLGIEAMTGHWEFTYGEAGIRRIIAAFKGEFIAQNVVLSDVASMEGKPAFDPDTGQVFRPYIIRALGDYRVAVIGQAFPYVPIAHPRRFVPDWRFGIRPAGLQKVVDEARGRGKVDVVVLLSHNGMDVDLKLAAHVSGIDVILGGHTHDAVPAPVKIANQGGATLVTNAGTAANFLGVLDLEIGKGRLRDARYTLLPIYADMIAPDPGVQDAIARALAPHRETLGEKLAEVGDVLYRRDNFYGSVDQVISDALREEMDAGIAFSPGFRWGNSFLPGDAFTMGDLLAETAITYPMAYTQEMTGATIKMVMEDVCDNLFNRDPYYQQGGDMIRVGGMNYACAPLETIGHRITEMALEDGTPIEATRTYKIASWASVNLPQTGKPVWEIVAANLRRKKTIAIGKPGVIKLVGVDGNPGYET
ncbi:MAG: thiosulfohydrolase SoxB [Acetobacteraceae bacterium]